VTRTVTPITKCGAGFLRDGVLAWIGDGEGKKCDCGGVGKASEREAKGKFEKIGETLAGRPDG
jgi:hypothetical protein